MMVKQTEFVLTEGDEFDSFLGIFNKIKPGAVFFVKLNAEIKANPWAYRYDPLFKSGPGKYIVKGGNTGTWISINVDQVS